jgi:hypothetical protein
MLTTIDNPFNPFDDYKSWLLFDNERNYFSAERLMRIAQLSDEMTTQEEQKEIERAIDEIIKYDVLNIYQKVERELEDPKEEDLEEG